MDRRTDIDDLIQRGIAAVQVGELEAARHLLAQAVSRQPGEEQAWLWLASAVDDVEQRRECLRRVLRLNPANDEALHRLLALDAAQRIDPARAAVDPARVQEFPCPACGANRRFSTEAGALVCPYCDQATVVLHAPVAAAAAPTAPGPWSPGIWMGQELYRCQNCAGTVLFSARQGSLECPFCGSSFVVASRTPGPQTVSQAVLPFRLDREAAEQALRRWMAGSWRVPVGLAQHAAIVQLHGVYVPFWLFGGFSLSDSTHAVTAPEDRMLNRAFHNVPVCAALSLTAAMARGLEPFDFDELLAYRPEYLAGWPVEQPQIAAFAASSLALSRVEWEPVADRAKLKKTRFVDSCTLALLPVFLGVYRHGGRLYAFAVNGQTGQVSARAPAGAARAIRAGLLATGVLGLLALLGWAAWQAFATAWSAHTQTMAIGVLVILTLSFVIGLALVLRDSWRRDRGGPGRA